MDLNFLRGEGSQADDPAADSLLIEGGGGLLLYNPSGAAGAAGANGFWHPWHALCRNSSCVADDIVVTASNSILFGSRNRSLSRSTDRGRTWNHNALSFGAIPIHESALPGFAGPAGERGIVTVIGDGGGTRISRADGAPGTWTHDGGQTWALVRRFTAGETGLPPRQGEGGPVYPFGGIRVIATPGGVLWASVHYAQGPSAPGVILRSDDLGSSWSRADDGFTGYEGTEGGTFPPSTPEQPFGWRVIEFALARTGVLYAATDRGVWRTTAPVVAGEAPAEVPSVGVAVRPNPASGSVEVVVSQAEAGSLRVVVLDALGREVAFAFDGAAAAGERTVAVDTSSWPAGVYVVRVITERGRGVATRFNVVR